LPEKFDWLKDEMKDFKTLTKLPIVLKFLKGKVKGPDDITKCTLCPNMCRNACPVGIVDGSETTSPSGKSKIGFFLKENILEKNKENVFPIYMCLSCGCCEKYCPFDFSVSDILHPIKTNIIDKGIIYDEFKKVQKYLEKYGYPYGQLKTNEDFKSLIKNSNQRILYLSGCSFRENYPIVISKTLKLFEKSGHNVGIISEEKCCGIPAYNVGDMKTYKKLAKENKKIINDFNPKMIVTSCPSCAYSYKILYPESGFEINAPVFHITEFLRDNISNLKLNKEKNMDITYHDPCKLVNGLKQPNIFSELLEKILNHNVRTPWRSSENTFCCGYGGSSICRINPKLSDEIAFERLKELTDFSNIIITACPSCKLAFENVKKTIDKEVNIYDIIEFVDLFSNK
jgi:Fe-S oxidoreductase